MTTYTPITVGDEVIITWAGKTQIRGTVVYIPQATGDAWHLIDEHGELFYIQQYDIMRRIPKPTKP